MSVEGPARSHNLANLGTTVLSFGVSIVVGLWFTPYLVHSLGAAAFGLIPLATTVVSYFSLLSQTLSATLSRNLSIAVGSGDHDSANRVFGVALGASLVMCLLLAVPLAGLAGLSDRLFQTPAGLEAETRALFGVVAASFVITLIGSCYGAASFTRNQIYLNNLSGLLQSAARVGLTVALFAAASARVIYAALAILAATTLSFVLNVFFAKRSAPWLNLFRPSFRKDVAGFYRSSGNQLLMQVGTVIAMSCEIVLVNRLFGEYQGGRYAAVIQWLLLLRNAAIALATLFVPTMLGLYARRDIDGLTHFARRAMRWISICVALPAGFLCGLAPQVLNVWLGPEFSDLWPIMCVQLAPQVLVSAIVPLYTISLAADKVFKSGLVQLGSAAIGVGLAILVVHQTDLGPIAVAGSVGLVYLAKELIFMPAYVAGNIGRGAGTFYAPLVKGVLLMATSTAASFAMGRIFELPSYLHLGLAGLGVAAIYLVPVVLLLDTEDRAILLNRFPRLGRRPA